PWVQDLGWTLLHFLWQGFAVGSVYWLARRGLRGHQPELRYWLAMSTLSVLVVLPVITFVHLLPVSVAPDVSGVASSAPDVTAVLSAAAASAQPLSVAATVAALVPWLAPLWMLGVACMTLRFGQAWRHARRLRATSEYSLGLDWQHRIQRLSAQLGIRLPVQIALSRHVAVPSVIGWLKPLVLVPAAAIAGLSPLQLELILIHELAHIRRQDYFWNLLQSLVETLLFYHPVVRWVSRDARLEREQCCDDAVVRIRGGSLAYARTLTELESLRATRITLLLGANGGQLVTRVQRLVGPPVRGVFPVWLPPLLAATFLAAVGLVHYATQSPLAAELAQKNFTLTGQDWPQVAAVPSLRLVPSSVAPQALPAIRKPPPITASIPGVESAPMSLPALPARTLIAAVPAFMAQSVRRTVTPAPPSVPRPRVLASRVPVYPAFARERGEQGSATVVFGITARGAVVRAHVTQVVGSRLFGAAALEALQHWRFAAPRGLTGSAAAQPLSISFQFQLRDADADSQTCRMPLGYHVCVN
ncbi:MAG: TonB family protein, partial [Gammaproteobacteria bacterium]